MFQKKSQITVFIILGAVILMIFLFLYVLTTFIQEDNSLVTSTQATLKNTLLISYVTKCLQRTATDGLSLIGNQGGKIFLTEEDQKINYMGKKVLVGISNQPLPSGMIIPFPFRQESTLFPFFGRDKIPNLCNSEGLNARNENFQPCLSYARTGSIQKQLDAYIEQKIIECSKLDTLFEGVEYQLPIAETIIGNSNILFNLYFPINYTIDNQIFELKVFNQEFNIRLEKFHEFIKALTKSEVSYSNFDILNNYNELQEYYEGFYVKVINDIASTEIDGDLIEITDFKSVIDGHAYSFKFVRENRPPVFFDIAVIVFPNRVEITPFIFDPDEDVLEITIDNSAFNELDGTFYMQPILVGPGRHEVTITIKDPYGLRARKRVEFEI